MKKCDYSVIVPAYNANLTLESCLNALLNQSISNYEVIVVNDGSDDQTEDIAKKFPVVYIKQPNKGPASARNNGAKKASGHIILFTDADCIPSRTWIEEMVKPIKQKRAAAVKGAYKTSQKSIVALFAQIEFEERFEMLKQVDNIDMVDTYSAAFDKKIFWQMGGFDESFPTANNEDTELSYKLSSKGYKMIFNPEAIVYHLCHPDTVIKYIKQKFWRGYWRMVVYKRFPKKMFKDTYTPQSLKFQILFIFGTILSTGIGFIVPPFFIIAAIFLLFFIISTLPFTIFVSKKKSSMALVSPVFLALRALSIGSGVIYFFLKRSYRLQKET